MNKYLAYYLRLSQDDGNTGDSNSIISQRQIIIEYISTVDELSALRAVEFIDDGYTGTNFNRPGMKQLLEAIKNGEISCIIVKDFSRFGRQYLEVSKYIEQIFPYLGIRFIALTDNYDSNNLKGTTAEIDVAVRNLINEMYSVDISKKVKSAKQTKIKQGVFANSQAIYGYKKDKNNKGLLLIDDPAAFVVNKIYNYVLDGRTAFQISEILNTENIPTPSAHKRNSGDERKWNTVNEDKIIWTAAAVYRILRDERYTGIFIGGMSESGKLGSNEHISKAKDEWVCIPHTHQAIISQEQFNKVSEIITGQSIKKITDNSTKPLYKKVWCGHCEHMMRYRGDTAYPFYFCETARYQNEYGCVRDKLRESELLEVVTITLLAQMKVFLDNDKIIRMAKNNIRRSDASSVNLESQIEDEINNLQSQKRKLYERFKKGEFDKTSFLQEREILENEVSKRTTVREEMANIKQKYESAETHEQQLVQSFLKYQTETELSKEMVDKFIRGVYIYDSKRIEIKFTFKDKIGQIFNNN